LPVGSRGISRRYDLIRLPKCTRAGGVTCTFEQSNSRLIALESLSAIDVKPAEPSDEDE
jgi:hypothetical protein